LSPRPPSRRRDGRGRRGGSSDALPGAWGASQSSGGQCQLAQAMRDLINEARRASAPCTNHSGPGEGRLDTSTRRQRRGDGRGGRWSSQWWGARAQPIRGVCEEWVTSR
jgi:hypothetical protein